MNWPLILDWAARIGAGTLIAISLVCFLVVSIRNLVSVIQLVLAARVFYSRVRPAARSYELWSRYADLAPPVSVIAPCYNEELAIADSVRALLDVSSASRRCFLPIPLFP